VHGLRLTRAVLLGALLVAGLAHAQEPASPSAPAGPTAAGSTPTLEQATALLQAGRFADAVPVLERITQAKPEDSQAWFLLGLALHGSGQLERALEVHSKAATYPERRAVALYNLACAHALLGHVDEAFEALTDARAAGFTNVTQLTIDQDLASLRGDPRWAQFTRAADYSKPFAEEGVTILHVWRGEAALDQFGWEAVDAGDVDGDGVHDVLTSAPFHREATGPEATVDGAPEVTQVGRIYVYSGRSGAGLFTRTGASGEQLGTGLSALGDVDGDGTPDLLVGAPCPGVAPAGATPGTAAPPSTEPGRAYVLSGKDGAVLRRFDGEAADDLFGEQVRGLGDVDGDGVPDLAIAAPQHDGAHAEAGRVTVCSGKSGATLFALDGEAPGDRFGSALGGATWPGDTAAPASGAAAREGLLVIGAMHAGEGRRGRVHVFRLRDGTPEPFFTIEADRAGADLGQYFVSVVGDVDADGTPDIYASDFRDGNQRGPANIDGGTPGGRVYLHSGKDGKRIASLPARSLGEGFGIGNAEAGDVNGDGHADLVVGAWTNGQKVLRAGRVYVISGKDRATLATFTGVIAGEEFGYDATGLGDVDGDGTRDFLVTAASSNDGAPKAGRVYVLSGAGVKGAPAK
jgi:hypothetical protein